MPVVLIVVQGGLGTIKTAREAVSKNAVEDCAIPVVLIKGSGGAADLITQALEQRYDLTEIEKEKFENHVRLQFDYIGKIEQDSLIADIWDCVKHKNMVWN